MRVEIVIFILENIRPFRALWYIQRFHITSVLGTLHRARCASWVLLSWAQFPWLGAVWDAGRSGGRFRVLPLSRCRGGGSPAAGAGAPSAVRGAAAQRPHGGLRRSLGSSQLDFLSAWLSYPFSYLSIKYSATIGWRRGHDAFIESSLFSANDNGKLTLITFTELSLLCHMSFLQGFHSVVYKAFYVTLSQLLKQLCHYCEEHKHAWYFEHRDREDWHPKQGKM